MYSKFFGDYRINILIAGVLIILGLCGRIEPIGVFVIALYWMSIRGFEKFTLPHARFLCFVATLLISLGLILHIFPGFHSMVYLDNYAVSPASKPHSEYWYFDKPFLALCLVNYYIEGHYKAGNLKHSIKLGLALTALCVAILAGVGMGIGYAKLDIKWPEIIYSFALINLVAILNEEGFFRGFLQKNLSDFFSKFSKQFGPALALSISSILFGLAHYYMGFIHTILCIVAGFIFGYGLTGSKRIEACMIVHFMLNMIHIIFFTYPSAV